MADAVLTEPDPAANEAAVDDLYDYMTGRDDAWKAYMAQQAASAAALLAASTAMVNAVRAMNADLTSQINALKALLATMSPTLLGFWAGTDTVGAGGTARTNYNRVAAPDYLGTPSIYRMFYSSMLPTNFVGSNAAFGPPCVVSFKASPADVLAGKIDAAFVSFLNGAIAAKTPQWWSYWHEPEDDIEDKRFTAEQYRAAWAHLLAIAPKSDLLHSTLILMRYSLSKTSRNISDYITPGIEVLAWDSYLTGNLTMKDVVDNPAATSAAFGMKFAIAEVSTDSTAKMLALADALPAAAHARGAVFVTWFETNKSDGDWRLRRDPKAVTSWRNAIAAQRVAAV